MHQLGSLEFGWVWMWFVRLWFVMACFDSGVSCYRYGFGSLLFGVTFWLLACGVT